MKKIIVSISLIFILVVSLSSCADFLDQKVLGQENINTYFKTKDECAKQVIGCYQTLFWDEWWKVEQMTLVFDMCTDDSWCGNTSQNADGWDDLPRFTGNKYTSITSNYWQTRYKGVLRANVVIDGISKTTVLDKDTQDKFLAEATFIRAFQYFELVKCFGGVPIVLEIAMPEDVVGIKRKTVAETYAQIEVDLLFAIEHLPERSEYASTDLGRATKGAAKAYLGKVYLYQGKYALAAEVLGEIITDEEYDLVADFGDVWSIKGNNNKESILEVQYSSVTEYSLGGRISAVTGSRDDSGWSWAGPTSNLEKAFVDAGDAERLKWTIIKHNATDLAGESAVDAENPYIISPEKHKSARSNRKLYIPKAERPSPYDSNHQPLNYRLMRFADVLLMYAEAQNEVGNDGEAMATLRRVRKRVNLATADMSGTTLRDAIRDERRLELALEGQRLFDIRRWKANDGRTVMANLMGSNGSFVKYNLEESTDVYEIENQKESSSKGTLFREDRDLLFPIPMSEISLSNGSIEQNPNY